MPVPAALPGLLALKPNPAVVLVFVPPDLTYGALLAYAIPARASHPTVYVFLPEEKKP